MSSELKSYHVSVSPRGDGNVQRRQAAGGDHGSAADVGSCSIKGGNEGLPAEWTSLAAGCLQGMIHLEIWWLLSDYCCVWDFLGYFGHFWMFICSFRHPPDTPRSSEPLEWRSFLKSMRHSWSNTLESTRFCWSSWPSNNPSRRDGLKHVKTCPTCS